MGAVEATVAVAVLPAVAHTYASTFGTHRLHQCTRKGQTTSHDGSTHQDVRRSLSSKCPHDCRTNSSSPAHHSGAPQGELRAVEGVAPAGALGEWC